MRNVRLCRLGWAIGLAALISIAGARPGSAQTGPSIGLVPRAPPSSPVSSLAVSFDGTRLLAGSTDNTLQLWDVPTGALLQVFSGHSDRVNSVALSLDGAFVLSGS